MRHLSARAEGVPAVSGRHDAVGAGARRDDAVAAGGRRGGAAPLEAARAALAGREAWLVGGAVRDRLLGRATDDLDVALAGDPREAARAIARATGGTPFELSGAFGAWRVVGPGHSWHVDLVALRDGDIAADLAARDFTINAMAEPLGGGELLDPHGGRADLEARRVRMVSERALADDPLRALRAVRLVTELSLELDPATAAAATAHAPQIDRVAPERVFGELKRVVTAPAARRGLALMDAHGLTAAVLPELAALHGIEQNEFHHADVHGHTLEVLDAVAALERDASALGEHAGAVAALLARPLGDELTRAGGMRFAALLHDAAKPQTRGIRPDGRVTFIGHDTAGAELARPVLRRLRASQRVVDYVAALTLHHLRVGFLVHERPLGRRSIWRYLRATAPYSADVTVFTVADRLATRGRNADEAIAAHLALARELLGPALAEPAPGEPLIRGDELARELQITPGPRLGELLAQLEEDRYAGEVTTREQAILRARRLIEAGGW
jgi:poly(A) polymerase